MLRNFVLIWIAATNPFNNCHAQITDPNSLQIANSKKIVTGYSETFFIDRPENIPDSFFRIQNGNIQISSDNKSWQQADPKILKNAVEGNWEGFDFLGAIGFRKNPIPLQETLDKNFKFDVLALGKEDIVEIGSKWVNSGGKDVPEVSVFKRKIGENDNQLLSSFQINNDTFQFRPSSAFFIRKDILIILASTDHPDINFFVFYDINQKKPVGFKAFSTVKYFPVESLMAFGQPLPKSLDKGIASKNAALEKISLFNGPELSTQLQDTNLFHFSK